jgi:23S rRNA pseudouridine1911/1915/1917 synthase
VAPQVQGKKAITHFCEVSSAADWSLVECKLETGRTHQIRVHLAFLEFPILGDGLYGGVSHSRMMLHAHRLRLRHPRTNDVLSFDVPWSGSDQKWLESQGLKVEPQIENRLKGI